MCISHLDWLNSMPNYTTFTLVAIKIKHLITCVFMQTNLIEQDRSCDHQRRSCASMRTDMIHLRGNKAKTLHRLCKIVIQAVLSLGSADSLELAGGRSYDALPNNNAFFHVINIHGNHKCL